MILGFKGIQADYVDLAYGNVALDLTGVSSLGDDWMASFTGIFGASFSFASLFGTTEDNVSNIAEINSFEVVWGAESFWLLHDSMFADDRWSFTDTGFS